MGNQPVDRGDSAGLWYFSIGEGLIGILPFDPFTPGPWSSGAGGDVNIVMGPGGLGLQGDLYGGVGVGAGGSMGAGVGLSPGNLEPGISSNCEVGISGFGGADGAISDQAFADPSAGASGTSVGTGLPLPKAIAGRFGGGWGGGVIGAVGVSRGAVASWPQVGAVLGPIIPGILPVVGLL